MTVGHHLGAPLRRTDTAGQVRVVEPEIVIAQAGVAVQGRPVEAGWEGLGARFARFLTAATLSAYGDWFTTVALVVLLYRLSGPAAPAGYMVARVLPRLISGMAGGDLADRVQPQLLVAACAVIQGLVTVSIIPSARIHALWAVYGAVVVSQFAGGLARPALGTLVPRVAPPQRLQRANALYGVTVLSSIAVGPALAAPLLGLAGPELLLVIDALTFGVAAVLLATLRPERAARTHGVPVPRGFAAGAGLVWRDPGFRATMIAWLASALAVTSASAVLVLIAQSFGNSSLVGYLYAAVGGGAALLGPLLLRVRLSTVGRDVIVAVAVVDILSLALVTLRGPFWAILICLAVNGASGMAWQTWGTTDIQARTPSAVLGRVTAVTVTAASLGMLVGAVLALALVPIAGWQHTLFISCCVSLAALMVGVLAGPQKAPAALRD